MDKLYWSFEYLKVFLGYITLFYIWPSIVFRSYLKGKEKIFRFLFCSTVQIVLINVTVLGLGLLHILDEWIIRILFYGVLSISIIIPIKKRSAKGFSVKETLKERSKWFQNCTKKQLLQRGKEFWKKYRWNIAEYLLLTIIIIFGMIYFSYSVYRHCSYGNVDEYTHHEWIRGLQQGEIFPRGIYPEGMHCFIYCLCSLFGIKLYSCIVFLSGIHILTFLMAAYSLFRTVYSVRYTPLLVLTAFLTVDGLRGGKALEAMTRLTWTLPQEFGLYLVFLCPLFLILFFRGEGERLNVKQWYKDEYLLLLALGVAAAISIHFYVIILAFFTCLPVAFIYLKKMLSGKRLPGVFCSVLCGVAMGSMPMIIAYFTGKKLEKSMYWGMNVISGEYAKERAGIVNNSLTKPEENIFVNAWEKGIRPLLGIKNAYRIAFIFGAVMILLCSYGLYIYIKKKRGDNNSLRVKILSGYTFLVLVSLFLSVLYLAPYMKLPELVYKERIISILKMMVLGMIGIPIDFILYFANFKIDAKAMWKRIYWGCVAIYFCAYLFDFHEYLYWPLRRYDAAVSVTSKIMQSFVPYTYRVISMVDEAYQVEGDGNHEELLDFIQDIEDNEYYFQEEYLFLYVEKHPILRGQTHFLTGPAWLADPSSEFWDDPAISQCPDIIKSEISREMAEKPITDFSSYWGNYNNLETRTTISSKAYYWYQDFAKMYPQETEVYYEDEDFVCYMIHQDTDDLLNLAIKDS